MRRPGMVLLVILAFVLPACSGKSKTESTGNTPAPSPASQTQTPQTPTQATPVRLVDKLPAGVEGVELAEGGLRVLEGYKYVKEKDGTFSIARMRDGSKTGTGGSCGCRGAGKCEDADQGGIIVCQKDNTCTDCGLRITAGGVTTAIFRY